MRNTDVDRKVRELQDKLAERPMRPDNARVAPAAIAVGQSQPPQAPQAL